MARPATAWAALGIAVGTFVVALAAVLRSTWTLTQIDDLPPGLRADTTTVTLLAIVVYVVLAIYAAVLAGSALAARSTRRLDFQRPFVLLGVLAVLEGLVPLVNAGVVGIELRGSVSTHYATMMLAGAAGLVASVLWRRGGQLRFVGAAVLAVGTLLLLLGDAIAGDRAVPATPYAASGVHPLGFDLATVVLVDIAFVFAAVCALLAARPARTPRYATRFVLCAAGVLVAVAFLLRFGDVLDLYDGMSAAFDRSILLGLADLCGAVGSTVLLLGGLGLGVGACLAFLSGLDDVPNAAPERPLHI